MTYYSISALINALVSILLGAFVLHRNYIRKINRAVFFWCFSVFFWSFAYFVWQMKGDKQSALLWVKILMLGAVWVPVAYFRVVTVFLEKEKEKKNLTLFVSALAVIFSLLLLTPLMVLKVEPVSGFSFWPKPGIAYHFFLFYFVCLSLYSVYLAVKALKSRLSPLKKLQIRYMILGIAISIIAGSTNYFLWYDIPIKPYGNIFVSTYVLFTSYAIIRYRLLGIRVIASRIYVYVMIGLVSYCSFYFIVFIDEYFFGGAFTARAMSVGIIFALIYGLLFLALLNKIQESSDILFFRGQNPRKIFKDLGLRLNSVVDIKQILRILSFEFRRILAVDDVSVVLIEERKSNYANSKVRIKCTPIFGKLIKLKKERYACVFKNIIKIKSVFLKEELVESRESKDLVIAKELEKYKFEVVAPLVVQSKVIGLILLGKKISDQAYTKDDIEFLEVISSQVAASISNAMLYEKIEKFNKDLQKKIESQTRDIKNKQERLHTLLNMRSEFLDITSHQLRTPVSVIKGVLSMLEEGSVPKSRIKEFMSMAFNKSLKLEQIVDEILRASEMDSERFELNLSPVDILPLIQEIYSEKLSIAKRNGVELILELPKVESLKVMSDLKYIKHVIINLVNNALQYTPKGSIKIRVKSLGGRAMVEIEDTGIGIPKKDIKKLYKKFSRVNNAKEIFTDGSGLGLYIIKKIIDAHKGAKVKIKKTEVNNGTTMVVSLPIIK